MPTNPEQSAPVAFEAAETMRKMRDDLSVALSDVSSEFPKDLAALIKLLGPKYPEEVQLKDAWGNPFRYLLDETHQMPCLISFGANGEAEAGRYDAAGMPKSLEQETTTDPNADIVLCGRYFLRHPEGTSPNLWW